MWQRDGQSTRIGFHPGYAREAIRRAQSRIELFRRRVGPHETLVLEAGKEFVPDFALGWAFLSKERSDDRPTGVVLALVDDAIHLFLRPILRLNDPKTHVILILRLKTSCPQTVNR
jgi:hypothetical protein